MTRKSVHLTYIECWDLTSLQHETKTYQFLASLQHETEIYHFLTSLQHETETYQFLASLQHETDTYQFLQHRSLFSWDETLPDYCYSSPNYPKFEFYVLLAVHPVTTMGKWPTWCAITLYKTFITVIFHTFLLNLHTGQSLTDAVLKQFDFLMMSTALLETCKGLQ